MKLTIVRGLPGTGKTTYAKSMDCLHLEADMYHIRGSRYDFNKENVAKAHDWCRVSAFVAMNEGFDVCVSNTFTTEKEMRPYINYAKERGYEIVVLRTTEEYKSIHEVPQEVMQKMRDRFEDHAGEIFI